MDNMLNDMKAADIDKDFNNNLPEDHEIFINKFVKVSK